MLALKLPKPFTWTSWLRRLIAYKNEGFALLSTMVVSSVLLTFGAAMITIATYEIREADRWRKSNEAYFLAQAAVAEAAYRLKSDYGNIDNQGYYIGPNTEGVSFGNGKFSFSIKPAGNVHFAGTKYMTGSFSIEAVGTRGYKRRGVQVRIERDTFLRYSRFVQQGSLDYAANANIRADLYVGGDLNLSGAPVTFWGDVEVGGNINNQWNGIFHGDISKITSGVNLADAVDINHYRDLSRGLIAGEGTGQYLAAAVTIDLSLYNFTGPVPAYNGNPLPADFNGVVFCEGDISIKGILEGRSLTFVSADDIVAAGNIQTGNTLSSSSGVNLPLFNRPADTEQVIVQNLSSLVTSDTNVLKFRISGVQWKRVRMTLLEDGHYITREDGSRIQTDLVRTALASANEQTAVINGLKLDPTAHTYTAEMHYFSSGTGDNTAWIEACEGDPVNIGFVAADKFYIHKNTPRQLTIDAAIFARDRNWEALGGAVDHPNGFDPNVWNLTINGPIITNSGGTAGPWASYGTRNYNYDMDMIEHAPPSFPVPSEWWKVAYWRHLRENEITL